MIYIITLLIGLVSLIMMGVLLFRHWKEIRLLNPDSIAEERERQKRDELLLQRLSRVKSEQAAPLIAMAQKALTAGKTAYHAAYLKLVKLERFYKQVKSPFSAMAPSVKDRVKLLLDDARSLARDMKWADAERRFIEVLAIDKRSIDAYTGLGSIYLKQKLYPQAKETFEFILKIKKADDVCYAALAEIAEAGGDVARAEEMRRKAFEFRPRLAHRHAELASYYLEHGQTAKAFPFAKRAAELEPGSAKYLELFLETAILVGDRNEAKRRYDKLRLLTDDRQKLQSLKEKIDAMST